MTNKKERHSTRIVEDSYKLGSTALTCARTRAYYTNMSYAQNILDEVTSGSQDSFSEFWHNFLRGAVHIFPNLMTRVAILEGRYISTSDAITRVGNCSFLELAAGLSPRSLEYAKEGTFYIETDQQEVIDVKQKVVRKIRGREGKNIANGHYFIALNPVDYLDMMWAGQLYISNTNREPIVILNEGLLEWQTKDEQRKIRDNIKCFLEEYSPNGAWISPDFTFTTKDNFVMRMIMRKMQRDVGRDFTVFESDEYVQDFLSDGGLMGERLPNEHLVEKLTCTEKIRLSDKKLRKLARNFQAYYITLK